MVTYILGNTVMETYLAYKITVTKLKPVKYGRNAVCYVLINIRLPDVNKDITSLYRSELNMDVDAIVHNVRRSQT